MRKAHWEWLVKALHVVSCQWLLDALEARKEGFTIGAFLLGFGASVHYAKDAMGEWGWLGLSLRSCFVGLLGAACVRGIIGALPFVRILFLVLVPATLLCAALSAGYSLLYRSLFR